MLEVRKVEIDSDDFKVIKQLKFYQKPEMAEIIDGVCHSGGVIFYVADLDERVCGYALAEMPTDDVCELMTMSVDPNFRNKKIGRGILDGIVADLHPKAIVAEVQEDSVEFFEKYGFYSSELGTSVNGLQTYYMTYRSK